MCAFGKIVFVFHRGGSAVRSSHVDQLRNFLPTAVRASSSVEALWCLWSPSSMFSKRFRRIFVFDKYPDVTQRTATSRSRASARSPFVGPF